MLREILHYTQVADKKLIGIFQSEQDISLKAISLFSHVLNAQHIWANRILNQQPKFGVWDEIGLSLFAEISEENFNLFETILDTIPLDEEVTYKNSKGEFTNLVQDILFHVANHSTYHRAQIATLIKGSGIHPPVTDYIMLKREHQL